MDLLSLHSLLYALFAIAVAQVRVKESEADEREPEESDESKISDPEVHQDEPVSTFRYLMHFDQQ